MNTLRNIGLVLASKRFLKKLFAYGLLILMLYILGDMLLVFFLTFIFAFLVFSLGEFIKTGLDRVFNIIIPGRGAKAILKQAFSLNVILIILYVIIAILLLILFSRVLPQLIKELYDLSKTMPFMQNEIQNITDRLEDIRSFNSELGGSITQLISAQDIQMAKDIFTRVKGVGTIFFEVFLSLILSVVFVFDREKIVSYFAKIKNSNFTFLYEEYEIIFERGFKSFGLIIKAQSIIAFTNTILTTIGLSIIGLVYKTGFPFILSFALLVFILGFVPVLGTFLSSIPLIIIAYLYVGGLNAALTVIALIVIVHAVEAYYLNPKVFGSFLELPMSLTFLILIVSEHFLGIAGLLIGVSLFYFFMGLLSETDAIIGKSKEHWKRTQSEEEKPKRPLKREEAK